MPHVVVNACSDMWSLSTDSFELFAFSCIYMTKLRDAISHSDWHMIAFFIRIMNIPVSFLPILTVYFCVRPILGY
jgi:hypothetical protein